MLLPSLDFGGGGKAAVVVQPIVNTHFFSRCRVDLRSKGRGATLSDDGGTVTITNPPAVMQVHASGVTENASLSDVRLQREGLVVTLRCESFRARLHLQSTHVLLHFVAAFGLLVGQMDFFGTEGAPVATDSRDKVTGDCLEWELKGANQLGHRVGGGKIQAWDDVFVGMCVGAMRLSVRGKVMAVELGMLEKFRPRVRIPVVLRAFLSLEREADEFAARVEKRRRRREAEEAIAGWAQKRRDLSVQVDSNVMVIEGLNWERSESASSGRDGAADEEVLVRESSSLLAAINGIRLGQAALELALVHHQSGLCRALQAACAVFACEVLVGMDSASDTRPGSGGSMGLDWGQRVQSAQRLIAEAVLL